MRARHCSGAKSDHFPNRNKCCPIREDGEAAGGWYNSPQMRVFSIRTHKGNWSFMLSLIPIRNCKLSPNSQTVGRLRVQTSTSCPSSGAEACFFVGRPNYSTCVQSFASSPLMNSFSLACAHLNTIQRYKNRSEFSLTDRMCAAPAALKSPRHECQSEP